MFRDRFAALVETDRKRQTIRPPTKRERDMPQVGDFVDCRAWIGLPYRSKQRKLHAEPRRITHVEQVHVSDEGFLIDGRLVSSERLLWCVARDDGFRDWPDMRDWFQKEHGLPFKGVLIRWEGKP
jgi:hypothetical protein